MRWGRASESISALRKPSSPVCARAEMGRSGVSGGSDLKNGELVTSESSASSPSRSVLFSRTRRGFSARWGSTSLREAR